MIRAKAFATPGISALLHAALLFMPAGSSGHAGVPNVPDTLEIAFEPPQDPPIPEALAVPASGSLPSSPSDRVQRAERRVNADVGRSPAPAVRAPATADAMPRFTIAIGAPSDAYGDVSPASAALAVVDADGTQPLAEALVDERARLIYGLSPIYPDDARAAGIEGDVHLELVVGLGGRVESARVVQSIDPSLDQAALHAAQKFRFDPAKTSGRPVRVKMRWSIQFRLR